MLENEIDEQVEVSYEKTKTGVWGEMKFEKLTTVHYLLTTFKMKELAHIKIVRDIPESAKWRVRELFQREINMERVEEEIIPYLENVNELKFFPPLTVGVLPIDNGKKILNRIPENDDLYIKEEYDSKLKEILHTKIIDHYEAVKCHKKPNMSYIKWNPDETYLVAIDGQHRLAALKGLFDQITNQERKSEISEWEIPITLLLFPDIHCGKSELDVIESIRQIFVKINTTSKEVPDGRQILLDDLSLMSICIQEFIEYSNNSKAKFYLPMFNWLSFDYNLKNSGRIIEQTHIFEIKDLRDYFQNWLLGFYKKNQYSSDGENQYDILFQTCAKFTPEERQIFSLKLTIPRERSFLFREEFNNEILPGFIILFSEFIFFKEYNVLVKELLDFCKKSNSSIVKELYDEYYYGQICPNKSLPEFEKQFREFEKYLKPIFEYIKPTEEESNLMKNKIGIRAIFYAYSVLKKIYDLHMNKTVSLKAYSEWFVKYANKIYREGWLSRSTDHPINKNHLQYICFDGDDSIINYKIEQIENAIGALVAYLICSLSELNDSKKPDLTKKFDDFKESIESTYIRENSKFQKSLINSSNQKRNEIYKKAKENVGDEDVELLKKEENKILKKMVEEEAKKSKRKFFKDFEAAILHSKNL